MDGLMRTRYPRNILITAQGANQNTKDMIRDVVAEKAGTLGLTIENVVDREGWGLTMARRDRSFSTTDGTYSNIYAVMEVFTQTEFQRFSCLLYTSPWAVAAPVESIPWGVPHNDW